MEQLDLFIKQFYALPQVESVVNSSGILRLAVLQYGKPLFLITCAFILLVLILIISRLKPKKGRPKKIKEPKAKPVKAAKPARRQKKAAGTPKSVMKNLAKIPDSPLPLYPVADKRKALSAADDAMMPVMPVVDDNSLIASLDTPEPAVAAPKPMMSSAPVQSFTLDSAAAAALVGAPAGDSLSAGSTGVDQDHDDFIMPIATEDQALDDAFNDPGFAQNDVAANPDLDINASFDDGFDDDYNTSDFNSDFNAGDLTADTDENPDDAAISTDDFDDIGASDDFDHGQSGKPKHEVTVDISPIGGDDFDMPVGSFGGGSDDNSEGELSPLAQQKLAELNDRNNG